MLMFQSYYGSAGTRCGHEGLGRIRCFNPTMVVLEHVLLTVFGFDGDVSILLW